MIEKFASFSKAEKLWHKDGRFQFDINFQSNKMNALLRRNKSVVLSTKKSAIKNKNVKQLTLKNVSQHTLAKRIVRKSPMSNADTLTNVKMFPKKSVIMLMFPNVKKFPRKSAITSQFPSANMFPKQNAKMFLRKNVIMSKKSKLARQNIKNAKKNTNIMLLNTNKTPKKNAPKLQYQNATLNTKSTVNTKKRNIVKPNTKRNVPLNTRKNAHTITKRNAIMKINKNAKLLTLKNVSLLTLVRKTVRKFPTKNANTKRKRNVTKYPKKLVKMSLKKNAKKFPNSIVTNTMFPNAKNTLRKNVPQSIRKSVRMSQFKYLSKSKNLLVFGQAPGQTMTITAANFWHPLKQTDKPDAKLFVKILVIFFCSIGISNCSNMSLWNQSI